MSMNLPTLRIICALFLVICTFSSCDEDEELKYILTVSKSVGEGGTVSPSKGTYWPGEIVRITVTPSEKYTFEGWQGDVNGNDNPLFITMDANKVISAVFEEKEMQ